MTTTSLRSGYPLPAHLKGLLRHFADLRDGIHKDGTVSRADKEKLFTAAIDYLPPYARQALGEMNDALLLASRIVVSSGVTRSPVGDVSAIWTLGWPEQERAGIPPVTLEAFSGSLSTIPTCTALL